MTQELILVISPKAVSTRVAVYENHNVIFLHDIIHPDQDLGRFSHYLEQINYRRDNILFELDENGICLDCIKAVVGRGGLVKPVESGIYEVNDEMLRDLKSSEYGQDHINLGGILAYEISAHFPEMRALISDPVTVDEYCNLARYTGHPNFDKKSVFHTLNHKSVAKKHAKSVMSQYEDMRLIVAHLGSGISVAAHKNGNVIDSNQVLDGDGPFSPERTGSLPLGDVIRYCFNSGKTEAEVHEMVQNKGGLFAYLNTYSVREVEKKVNEGDKYAEEVFSAMAYQVGKEIGAMFAVLEANVDAILITGGIAKSSWFVNKIVERVGKMADVHIYPGDYEEESMVNSALAAIRGEVEVLKY